MLSPLQQLRVVCAGVWHNIVLFGLAWAFLWTGALQLSFRIAGWREMDDGLSVVNVVNVRYIWTSLNESTTNEGRS